MEVRMTKKEYIDLGVEAVKMLSIARIYPWLCIVYLQFFNDKRKRKPMNSDAEEKENERRQDQMRFVCFLE